MFSKGKAWIFPKAKLNVSKMLNIPKKGKIVEHSKMLNVLKKAKGWMFMQRQWQELNVNSKARQWMNWTFSKRQEAKGRRPKMFGDGSLSTVMLLYRPECSSKGKAWTFPKSRKFQKLPNKLQKARMCLGHFHVPSTPWNAPENWVTDTLTRVWTWKQMTKKTRW